jgi:mono/diheme cytochrome c family protein
MLKKRVRVRLSDFFPPRPFRWERTGVRARNLIGTSVFTVAFAVVWLLVGSATVAVAASASGNDPGASTFEEHCATCHAPNGSGDTVVGKSMKIPDLRSPALQSQPDTQLADVIANGKGLMPGFKSSLSKDEIDALVKHVHLLAGKKAVSQ